MNTVQVVGGGPAGAAAAIAALRDSAVTLIEKTRLPKHKVCGEFLSPEIAGALENLGCLPAFLALQPSRIRRMTLRFGSRQKRATLPEAAYGLSRQALDQFLREQAAAKGATLVNRRWSGENGVPTVLAAGRRAAAPVGDRLFGFKAHFEGPVGDAVDLFFFDGGGYAGVSAVEAGRTNVCGLAPERALRASGFDFDEFLARSAALAERLRPLRRTMDWIAAGPLVFARAPAAQAAGALYPAGDALGFIDPFTGSGVLNAVLTGRMAGEAAARGRTAASYLGECRRVLARPFHVALLLRAILRSGWADLLAAAIPGEWLFRLTRPRCAFD